MEAEVKTGRVARPTPPSIRNVAPVALTVACAGAFSFLSGGYIFTRSAPLAIAYLLLAALWVWFLRRGSRPSPLYLCALGTFGLFVAWVGLSVLWSLGPDLSWMAFDLAALYLVVAAVLGLTPVRRLQLLVAAAGFLVVAVAVAVYAYLGKVLPDVVTHAHTYARLDSPIGYWNVLALMMIMALMVVLALAGDRRVRAVWRMLAAVAGVPLCFTFFFTLSRGGWIALAVALVVYFALCTTRLASLATLVAVAAPVAAALWRVRDLGTLFQATTDDILRTQQGHILLRYSIAALVIAGGAQAVVLLLQGGVPWPRWSRVAAGVAILVLLVGGVGGGSFAFVQARGGVSWVKARVHAFASDSDTTQPAEGTVRLVSVNTGRPPLWREALDQARLDPVTGSGAGTFAFTNYRFRKTGGVVKHAHSEWFNVLSELGIVGLVLFVASMLLFVATSFRNPLRDRGDPMRSLVVAFQAGILAFLVHISWDWDWDMAAIGFVFFLFVAVGSSYLATRAGDERRRHARELLGEAAEDAAEEAAGETRDAQVHVTIDAPAGLDAPPAGSDAEAADNGDPPPVAVRPAARGTARWPVRAAATTALVLLAVSWTFPYLALRAANAALAESASGNVVAALSDARHAARLDPLAVDPLLTEALVLQQQGKNDEALAVLGRAQRLQPANYEVYYAQGQLLLNVFGRKAAAVAALEHALALNPLDAASASELLQALGH
ncbi:MAG TPA: O-antigen ligase family protein [Thermoleophilia bacterium]|nr:O-antigen ligase family protein [Thermoleophilia bacterium]